MCRAQPAVASAPDVVSATRHSSAATVGLSDPRQPPPAGARAVAAAEAYFSWKTEKPHPTRIRSTRGHLPCSELQKSTEIYRNLQKSTDLSIHRNLHAPGARAGALFPLSFSSCSVSSGAGRRSRVPLSGRARCLRDFRFWRWSVAVYVRSRRAACAVVCCSTRAVGRAGGRASSQAGRLGHRAGCTRCRAVRLLFGRGGRGCASAAAAARVGFGAALRVMYEGTSSAFGSSFSACGGVDRGCGAGVRPRRGWSSSCAPRLRRRQGACVLFGRAGGALLT